MGFASHLGPWQLGTVKDTTGSTSGTVRNMGSTIVSQTKKIDYTGTTVAAPNTTQIAVLPAGAQIIDINVDTLVAFHCFPVRHIRSEIEVVLIHSA